MPLNLKRYTLDTTGVDPNNLVVNEQHTLTPGEVDRAILVPTYGCFYRDGLTITDAETGEELKFGKDYLLALPLGEMQIKTGKEIYEGIVFKSEKDTLKVILKYQCLGGGYSISTDNLMKIYEAAVANNKHVEWKDISNVPTHFTPTEHAHILSDVYGFGPVIYMLERIRNAITMSDSGQLKSILNAVSNNSSDISKILTDMRTIRDQIIAQASNGSVSTINDIKKLVNKTLIEVDELKLIINGNIEQTTINTAGILSNKKEIAWLKAQNKDRITEIQALQKSLQELINQANTRFIRKDQDDATIGNITFTKANKSIGSGIVDKSKIVQVWSINASAVHNTGDDFGDLTGLSFKDATGNVVGGDLAGGLQLVWTNAGEVKAAIGDNGVWVKGGVQSNGTVRDLSHDNWKASYTLPETKSAISNGKASVGFDGESIWFFGPDEDYGYFNGVNGDFVAKHKIIAHDEVEIQGKNMLKFATYGGGIYMSDNEWMRISGGKKFYVSNDTTQALYTRGGVKANRGFYWGNQSLDDRYLRRNRVVHTYTENNTTKWPSAQALYKLWIWCKDKFTSIENNIANINTRIGNNFTNLNNKITNLSNKIVQINKNVDELSGGTMGIYLYKQHDEGGREGYITYPHCKWSDVDLIYLASCKFSKQTRFISGNTEPVRWEPATLYMATLFCNGETIKASDMHHLSLEGNVDNRFRFVTTTLYGQPNVVGLQGSSTTANMREHGNAVLIIKYKKFRQTVYVDF